MSLAAEARAVVTARSIPKPVLRTTQQQIRACVGTNVVRGIPLVDPTIDWLAFTNWPDTYIYQGHTYELRLDRWGGDYMVPLKSRSNVTGVSVWAWYARKGGSPYAGLLPNALWRSDGTVGQQALNWMEPAKDIELFIYQFGPTGALVEFIYTDITNRDRHIQLYNREGALVGEKIAPYKKPARAICYRWLGRPVEPYVFDRLSHDFLKAQWPGGRFPAKP